MSSRRQFIKQSAIAAAGLTIIPSHVMGRMKYGTAHTAPSDKLNIAGVGIGGKGHANLGGMNTENIIGLCDVDWKYAEKAFNRFPEAKKYKDWRVMFDEIGKDIDAVMVATPDHTHAGVAATALTMEKHVYCQKHTPSTKADC